MPVQQFRLPDPGEGLTEAEIVTWRVAAGDTVKVNDIVVEVETAKSLVELPVPFAGKVTELLVHEGETVEVGTPIISVETTTGAPTTVQDAPDEGAVEPGMIGSPAPKVDPTVKAGTDAQAAGGATTTEDDIEEGKIGGTTSTGRTAVLVGYGVKQTEAKRRPRKAMATDEEQPASMRAGSADHHEDHHPHHNPDEFVPAATAAVGDRTERAPRSAEPVTDRAPGAGRVLAKPPVRKLAKDLGVNLDEVPATGTGGVITRSDVEAYAGNAAQTNGLAAAATEPMASVRTPVAGEPALEERIPVKGVRKMTAQAMVQSAFTAPHVTEWITVDVTKTMDLLENLKRDKEFRDVKVTPLLVLAKALCLAISRNPGINATWDEDAQEIVVKRYVNLGIAAATPRGLLVPNIKNAQTMTMRQLADAIGELTATARDGRTQPADMAGGTVTITNVGVFGVDSGTPILNPGESAIVCFGAIRKQPWVVMNAAGEDEIAIRHITQLAVSFDHRLIDGELGSRFLADLAAILEDPSRGLVWG
jgi:pyruvate dehydrogenase E2 component (dihydrolipoamide acetyltransferase)